MKTYSKRDFPVSEIRRFLEPGPIVLVSSRWKDETDIMTMGWHTVMEFTPSFVGCIISNANHSFVLIRRSRECVINVPEVSIAAVVAKIGNSSGASIDKFREFGLNAVKADKVGAPLIAECHTSLECKLADARLVEKYNFFIFEVVKAHVATQPKLPKTIHYRGGGRFMISGAETSRYLKYFKRDRL